MKYFGAFLMIVLFFTLLFPKTTKAVESRSDLSTSISILSESQTSYQYRVSVTNSGPDMAENVVIVNPLPKDVNGYLSHLVAPYSPLCNTLATNLDLCVSQLSPGSMIIADYVMNVESKRRFVFIHKIYVTSDSFDRNHGNNNNVFIVKLPYQYPNQFK